MLSCKIEIASLWVRNYPVIPLLAILSGVYVIISQLFLSGTQATILSLASIAVTLLGLPVLALVRKNVK